MSESGYQGDAYRRDMMRKVEQPAEKKAVRVYEYDGSYSIRRDGHKQVIVHSKDDLIEWLMTELNARPSQQHGELVEKIEQYIDGFVQKHHELYSILKECRAALQTTDRVSIDGLTPEFFAVAATTMFADKMSSGEDWYNTCMEHRQTALTAEKKLKESGE